MGTCFSMVATVTTVTPSWLQMWYDEGVPFISTVYYEGGVIMKGYVDKSACIGCGMCVDTAPDAFRIGDDGLAEGYQEIPADKVDDAKEAAADCPVGAIEVK